jgi:hypothetical protein
MEKNPEEPEKDSSTELNNDEVKDYDDNNDGGA